MEVAARMPISETHAKICCSSSGGANAVTAEIDGLGENVPYGPKNEIGMQPQFRRYCY